VASIPKGFYMLVHHFLELSAERFPDKTALICEEQRMSYRELHKAADRIAAALIGMGLRRREQVIVFLENSPEAVISIFAILKAGGVFVLLNPGVKAAKLSYIINDCAAAIIITHRAKASIAEQALQSTLSLRGVLWCGEGSTSLRADLPGRACVLWSEAMAGASPATSGGVRSVDLDLATLIYTSGSTGEPKGVMSNHLNMVAATRSITSYLHNSDDDIVLSALPLSFGYGLYQILATFFVGGTVVLEKSFAFPYRILERMVEERITGSPFVPTMIALLLQMDLSRFDLGTLRYVTNAGAALPVPYIRRFRELFPKIDLYSMYGLTECTRALYLPPEEIDRRPDSVGIPIPNEEVFLMDENGEEVPAGTVGELVVRGSHVAQGYWNSPELTARVFRPGRYRSEAYLHTGDLFRRDEEGYFYFVARKDELIKTRGERVSPKEIEDTICALRGVAEAAVTGVPDAILGQAIRAFVVPAPGHALTEEDVLRHCLHTLEPFMVPKYVELRDSLPKSPSGKLDRKSLKAEAPKSI
jgi:long-chain acyl-CoA synthetase